MTKGKISFKDSDGNVIYSVQLNSSQIEFWNAEEQYVLLSGGVGCIGGETIIDTVDPVSKETVGRRVDELYRNGASFYVRDGNGAVSVALPPVRYQPKQLYALVTRTNGVESTSVVTGDHYVQSDRSFVSVDSLTAGQLLVSAYDLHRSNSVSFQSVLFLGALRLSQKLRGSLVGCHRAHRSCGALLRLGVNIYQALFPSQVGVRVHTQHGWRSDAYTKRGHTHPCQSSCHLSKKDSFHQNEGLVSDEANHTYEASSQRASGVVQLPQLSLGMIFQSVGTLLGSTLRYFLPFLRPLPNPTVVVSVSPLRVDTYYDFHVVGTHTYQAHGLVHHNSGKSMVMLLKVIVDAISQDDNYILVGRNTYQEIHDVLIKDFFQLCHKSWVVSYKKTPHPTVVLRTANGGTSEIIFRNLDKVAKSELLGLNLGGFAIDQAEDVEEEIVLTLKGRLRRKGINHKGYMTSNPRLTWLYRVFKQEKPENHRLIEVSTMENKNNLPESYLKTLEQFPESWYRQYVLGIWDESLLSDNIVFAREHIERLSQDQPHPFEMREGLRIYHPYQEGHTYKIGVDMAEGGSSTEESLRKERKDSAVIVVWDHTDDREVATWSGRVSPRITAEKALWVASLYGNPEIIPEMNSMGISFIEKMTDEGYTNLYRREEFDRIRGKKMEKYGWRMTSSTKQLVISHFEELLRKRRPVIHTRETIDELKTFVYTDEAKKNGAGAQHGYHDDRVIATLLAAYSPNKVEALTVTVPNTQRDWSSLGIKPSFEIVNGRARPLPNKPGRYAHWTALHKKMW